MKEATKCPICGNEHAIYENWHDDIMGCWTEVEWIIHCHKCKFSEHWAYGSYCDFNKPKGFFRKIKYKIYVRRALNDNERCRKGISSGLRRNRQLRRAYKNLVKSKSFPMDE